MLQILDNILTSYSIYIDDDVLDSVIKLKHNRFTGMFLGSVTDSSHIITHDSERNKFAVRVALYNVRNDIPGNRHGLIFADNELRKCRNVELLKEFIEGFFELRNHCILKRNMVKNYGIEYYYKENCGRVGLAIK